MREVLKKMPVFHMALSCLIGFYTPIVLIISVFNPIISPKELRSFALMQKNQKIKASAASLLAPYTPLFASQTRFAQTAMLPVAPLRSFA